MIATSAKTIKSTIPFGTLDLHPEPVVDHGPPRKVRCYVRGCHHFLRVPRRGFRGDVCPDHGVRCHYSSGGGTYSYADPAKNIIASPQVFKDRIIGHPFKYESHRLGLERSEDALSWNTFRSLQEAGLLHQVASMITGEEITFRPFLFLWGICTNEDDFQPWDLLIAARKRFESHLPVERPLTEPDIALYLPGRYLILIEAKFTSANTFYQHGPRANTSSLTLKKLIEIYQSPELKVLDYDRAKRSSRVYYQLWRNMVFAEWMARADHPNTKAYHVNLVREGCELQSAGEFKQLIRREFSGRFQRMTWEQIHRQVHRQPGVASLARYLETKTAGLKRAFSITKNSPASTNEFRSKGGM